MNFGKTESFYFIKQIYDLIIKITFLLSTSIPELIIISYYWFTCVFCNSSIYVMTWFIWSLVGWFVMQMIWLFSTWYGVQQYIALGYWDILHSMSNNIGVLQHLGSKKQTRKTYKIRIGFEIYQVSMYTFLCQTVLIFPIYVPFSKWIEIFWFKV